MTLVLDMATLRRIDQHDSEFVRIEADGEPPVADAELVGACCEAWKRRHDALEHSCSVLADNLLDAQRERDAAHTRIRELEHAAIERAQPCANPCRACMGSGCDCGSDHGADCAESLRATIAALEAQLEARWNRALATPKHIPPPPTPMPGPGRRQNSIG